MSVVFCSQKYTLKSYFKETIFEYEEIDVANTPTKKDYPDANAVYLLREGKYKIQTILVNLYMYALDVPWSAFSEHIVLKVLDEGGRRYADIKIPFWEGWELLDLKARTIKPNGEIVILNTDEVYEISYFPKYILYADRKAKVFSFPAVDTGCILEYIYTLGYREPYVPRWYFQAREPTLEARFSYDIPKMVGFDYTQYSQPGVNISKNVKSTSSRHHVEFTAHDLPAIRYEALAPPIPDVSSWIFMSWAAVYYFKDRMSSGQETWYEIGKNYSLKTDTIFAVTECIKTKANEITADCDSDEEKIRAIFEYVQDCYRYVAVEIEGHRIFPNLPAKVLLNQYGDCKDLSGLLISLLRACEIDAYPVLIGTKKLGQFIEGFPTFGQFNHVITGLPVKYFENLSLMKDAIAYGNYDFMDSDDYVILDPTAETVPIGHLHMAIQGRNAVICAGQDSKLIKLPESHFSNNEWQTSLIFNFDNNGYNGEMSLNIKGEDAALLKYRIINSSQLEIKDYILMYLNDFPLKLSLDTFIIDNIEKKDTTLTIKIKFTEFSPLQTMKNQIFVPVMLRFISQFKDVCSYNKRNHDIEFGYPQAHRDLVKMVIPAGYKLGSLPDKENIKNHWCEYLFSSYVTGDTVIINRNIVIKQPLVPKEAFEELRSFSAKVLDSSHRVVVFSKK